MMRSAFLIGAAASQRSEAEIEIVMKLIMSSSAPLIELKSSIVDFIIFCLHSLVIQTHSTLY